MEHLLEQQKEMDYYERQEQRLRLNNQNRAEIAVFHTLHPETWLGRVGYFGEERELVAAGEKSPLVQYDGGMVFDCQYDFCIPTNDGEMLGFIRQWNAGERSLSIFNQIYDRVRDLGGIYLIWH